MYNRLLWLTPEPRPNAASKRICAPRGAAPPPPSSPIGLRMMPSRSTRSHRSSAQRERPRCEPSPPSILSANVLAQILVMLLPWSIDAWLRSRSVLSQVPRSFPGAACRWHVLRKIVVVFIQGMGGQKSETIPTDFTPDTERSAINCPARFPSLLFPSLSRLRGLVT